LTGGPRGRRGTYANLVIVTFRPPYDVDAVPDLTLKYHVADDPVVLVITPVFLDHNPLVVVNPPHTRVPSLVADVDAI